MTDHQATVDAVLAAGGSITIRHDPGTPGAMGDDGYVAVDPVEPGYIAVLADADGIPLRTDEGATVAEAIAALDVIPELVDGAPF